MSRIEAFERTGTMIDLYAKRFAVHVYETGLDPGGYYDIFLVDALDANTAAKHACVEAAKMWPDHRGLDVWKVEEVDV